MNSPHISVVLPTFNRKDKLRECLASLERQTFSHEAFEVIVVDDGSTDGTAASVQEFLQQTKLHLKYVHSEHTGPGVARNIGVGVASGGIIAFTEDDVIADEHWLERAAKAFQAKPIDCLEGTTLLQGSTDPVRVFDDSQHLSFIPCNLFIKKEVFVRLGGYDSNFFDRDMNLYFREDADLGFRLLQSEYIVHKANDVVVSHPQQYFSAWDAFKHCKRFYFDPLLYSKHRRFFRNLLEVKKMGFLSIKRVFHHICLFYILFFLVILITIAVNKPVGIIVLFAMLLIVHTGIRFRYERSYIPKLWNVVDTALYAVLPFYYMYWFMRGCKRFKSWGCFL